MGCSTSVPIDNNIPLMKDREKIAYDKQFWRSNDECCICLDQKSNILLLPCNHMIICDQCCASIYNSKKCPICQGDVYSYNLLYLISSIPNPNYNI